MWMCILHGSALYVAKYGNFFSLAAFMIFLFLFNLWHFHYDVSWSGPLCIHLVWDSLCFLEFLSISFTKLGKFSSIIFSNRFPISYFLFSFWHNFGANVGPLELVPEAAYTILFFGVFFLFCSDWWLFFASLYSKSLMCFLASSTLLLFPCYLFFISISVPFVSDWIFFMLVRSSLSSLSILITSVLKSASDRLLISISFCSFSGVLFCSFTWAMFLYFGSLPVFVFMS